VGFDGVGNNVQDVYGGGKRVLACVTLPLGPHQFNGERNGCC